VAASQLGSSYWRYLKLVAARVKTRGLLAGLFALLAFAATVSVIADDPSKAASWGSLFTLLSAIFAALTVIRVSMKAQIEDGYSLAFALAHGYVNNFARQAIADLQTQSADGRFVVFRPNGLDELDDASVETFKLQIAGRGYKSSVRRLAAQGKRVRDVLMIESQRGEAGQLRYVDFPATLLTLKSLVDYRSEQRRKKSGLPLSDAEQNLITQELIAKFFDEVVQMLASDVAKGHVVFTDSRMVHL
jgi:nucleotide-binding STING sensor domain-containing protein